MASTRQLKHRVKSVKGTRQITKAMQLVAASKMRSAQEIANQVHLYSEACARAIDSPEYLPRFIQSPLVSYTSSKSSPGRTNNQ